MLEESGYEYDKDFVDSYDFDDLYDGDLIDDFLHEALKGKDPYVELSQMVQNAGFDGIWAESEIIAFEPYQIKRTDNKAPTSNPDIRYSLEDEEEISNNLEIKTKKGYTGNTRSSRKTEWHTDLTKTQMKQVLKWLDVAGTPEANRITDTAYWYNGRLDGEDLFVIYSTEDPTGKTILYEVKGENAKLELDILTDLLEGEENGESINGESSFTQRVSEGNWLLYGDRSQSDLRHLGRGEYNQNAGILPKQPQRNGSRAFRNVVENLFAEQRRIGRQYSLDDLDEAPSKQTKAFLDAIDDLRNGKRNAADKLAKYVDSGTISTKD